MTMFIRSVTSCSHSLMSDMSASSESATVSRNHGRAGLVMPDIMPDESVRAAKVGVESMMFWFRRSPLLTSLTKKRPRRGLM